MNTEYKGIDYGTGKTNVDKETGIRYGVISQLELLQAWADESEPDYGTPEDCFTCPECDRNIVVNGSWGDDAVCPECDAEIVLDLPDMIEANCYVVNKDGIQAECSESGDIFITKSPYYTRAQFCSPCAPGACYLTSSCPDGERAYCFGHDWFYDTETGKAPYLVYRVDNDELMS